jgi:hypothetical protein
MKTYVSYVIQKGTNHVHKSEIVTTQSPSYSFSPDPQVPEIMEWADKKRKNLEKNEELVIVGMYKVQ